MVDAQLFKQGAEAKLHITRLFARPVVKKERFIKSYRLPQLDQRLSRKRTLQEVRTMYKCRKAGIRTPLPYFVNVSSNEIFMEHVENSWTLREHLEQLLSENQIVSAADLDMIADKIGNLVCKLHSNNIIHGDLTTSNILITKDGKSELILIDFGLSSTSNFSEDMGVDLYVLERAFLSTHPNTEWLFDKILDSYFSNLNDMQKGVDIKEKLDEIRLRGRKRVMIG